MPDDQGGLPDWLNTLVTVLVGDAYPNGSPSGMFELSGLLGEFNTLLAEVPGEVARVRDQLEAAGVSPTLQMAADFVAGAEVAISGVREALGTMEQGAVSVGVEIEYAQGMVVVFAIMLGLTLARAALVMALSGGTAAPAVAAEVAQQTLLLRAMAMRVLRRLAIAVVGGALMMASVSGVVQAYQVWGSRTRTRFDWEQVGAMAAIGALGGAIHVGSGWMKRWWGNTYVVAMLRSVLVETGSEVSYNLITGNGAPFPVFSITSGAVEGALERAGRGRSALGLVLSRLGFNGLGRGWQVPTVPTPRDLSTVVGGVEVAGRAPEGVGPDRVDAVNNFWRLSSTLYGSSATEAPAVPDAAAAGAVASNGAASNAVASNGAASNGAASSAVASDAAAHDGPAPAQQSQPFLADVSRAADLATALSAEQRWQLWAGLADAHQGAERAMWDGWASWQTVMPQTPVSVLDAATAALTGQAREEFLTSFADERPAEWTPSHRDAVDALTSAALAHDAGDSVVHGGASVDVLDLYEQAEQARHQAPDPDEFDSYQWVADRLAPVLDARQTLGGATVPVLELTADPQASAYRRTVQLAGLLPPGKQGPVATWVTELAEGKELPDSAELARRLETVEGVLRDAGQDEVLEAPTTEEDSTSQPPDLGRLALALANQTGQPVSIGPRPVTSPGRDSDAISVAAQVVIPDWQRISDAVGPMSHTGKHLTKADVDYLVAWYPSVKTDSPEQTAERIISQLNATVGLKDLLPSVSGGGLRGGERAHSDVRSEASSDAGATSQRPHLGRSATVPAQLETTARPALRQSSTLPSAGTDPKTRKRRVRLRSGWTVTSAITRSASTPSLGRTSPQPGRGFVPRRPGTIVLSSAELARASTTLARSSTTPDPRSTSPDPRSTSPDPRSTSPDPSLAVDPAAQTLAKQLPENWALTRDVASITVHPVGEPDLAAPSRPPFADVLTVHIGSGIAALQSADDDVLDAMAAYLKGLPTSEGGLVVRFRSAHGKVSPVYLDELARRLFAGVPQLVFLAVPAEHVDLSATPRANVVPVDRSGSVTLPALATEYLVTASAPPGMLAPAPYGWQEAPTPGRTGRTFLLADGWQAVYDGNALRIEGPPGTGVRQVPPAVREQLATVLRGLSPAQRALVQLPALGAVAATTTRPDLFGAVLKGPTDAQIGAMMEQAHSLPADGSPVLLVHVSMNEVAIGRALDAAIQEYGPGVHVHVAGEASRARPGADFANLAANLLEHRPGTFTVDASLVRDRPDADVTRRPLDAQGAVTFAELATHYQFLPPREALEQPETPYGLTLGSDRFYEFEHWRVRLAPGGGRHVQIYPRSSVAPSSARLLAGDQFTIDVAMPGGQLPPAVQELVSLIAHGQPDAATVARLDDAAAVTRPAAAAPPKEAAKPAPVPAPREALGFAIPRGVDGMPVQPLVTRLKHALARFDVTDAEWSALPDLLLTNYRHLVSGGFVTTLGRAEVRIRLNPDNPVRPTNPGASFRSVVSEKDQSQAGDPVYGHQATHGAFSIGWRGANASGRAGQFTARASLGFLFQFATGVLGLNVGPALGITANQDNRTSASGSFTEKGRVSDFRERSTLYAYDPGWQVEYRRADDNRVEAELLLPDDVAALGPTSADYRNALNAERLRWRNIDIGAGDGERLLVWVPDRFLTAPPDQVTPAAAPGQGERLPRAFYATLNQLPQVYDDILTELVRGGVDIATSGLRTELRAKLWNLATHLDEAIDGALMPESEPVFRRGGYTFTLHDAQRKRPVAMVALQAQRIAGDSIRLGITTDTAPVETVGTVLAGESTAQSLTNTTSPQFTVGGSRPDSGNPAGMFVPAASASVDMSNGTSQSAGRTGLVVHVDREIGRAVNESVPLAVRAKVTTYKQPKQIRTTQWVPGRAQLHVTEEDAIVHGFPVDAERPPPPEPVPSGRLPQHLLGERQGAGMSFLRLDPETVRGVERRVIEHLQDAGFLPRDLDRPFDYRPGETARDSRIANLQVLREGFLPHTVSVNAAAQGRYNIVLQLNTGTGEARRVSIDVAVTLNLSGELDEHGNSIYSRERAKGRQLVILTMGMTGPGRGEDRRLGLGGSVTGNFWQWVTGGVAGTVSTSAADQVGELINLPKLLEFKGPSTFELPSTDASGALKADPPVRLRVTATYSEVGPPRREKRLGRWRWQWPANWTPPSLTFDEDVPISATLFTLPIPDGTTSAVDAPMSGSVTPAWVFDRAAVVHTDFGGLRQPAEEWLNEERLGGVGWPGHEPAQRFLSPVSLHAFFPDLVHGGYTTTGVFDTGMIRHKTAGMGVRATVGGSRFLGPLDSPQGAPTLGLIELLLRRAGTTTSGGAAAGLQLPGLLGNEVTRILNPLQPDGLSARATFDWTSGQGDQVTGGVEYLKLGFEDVVAFSAPVTYSLDRGVQRAGKLYGKWFRAAPTARHRSEVIYLLSKSDALAAYGKGAVPLSEAFLNDAMAQWMSGTLELSADTVATVLTRWLADSLGVDATSVARQLQVRLWATELANRHRAGTHVILDSTAREQFNAAFEHRLVPKDSAFHDRFLPPYLSQEYPQLGHAAVESFEVAEHSQTPLAAVRALVEQLAPRLLPIPSHQWADHGLGVWYRRWTENGVVLGELPGGLETLEGLLTGTRIYPLLDEMLGPQGVTFCLTHQVGPVLSDSLEITMNLSFGDPLKFGNLNRNRGLETYRHDYKTRSRFFGRGYSGGGTALNPSFGEPVSARSALTMMTGMTHRSEQKQTTMVEETVYDWGDAHEVYSNNATLEISVRRVGDPNRPVNNAFAGLARRVMGRTEAGTTIQAKVVLRLPKGIADARAYGPALAPAFTPVKPPTARFTLAVDMDAHAEGRRFLQRVFRPRTAWARRIFPDQTGNPRVRQPAALNKLTRAVVTSKIRDATSDGYRLGTVLQPGHLRKRATVVMRGAVLNPRIVVRTSQPTGAGYYGKSNVETSQQSGSSRWRADFNISLNGTIKNFEGVLHGVDLGGVAATFGNPLADGTSHTIANRDESHVKQQGPTVIVALDGRFHLRAQRHDALRFWLRSPANHGEHTSEPIAGTIFLEMFQDEAEALIREQEQARQEARQQAAALARAGSLPAPEVPLGAPVFDLMAALADASSRPGTTTDNAAHKAADVIMEQIRALPEPPAGQTAPRYVLTYDRRTQARHAYGSVLASAVGALRSLEAWYRQQGKADAAAATEQARATVEGWQRSAPPGTQRERIEATQQMVAEATKAAIEPYAQASREWREAALIARESGLPVPPAPAAMPALPRSPSSPTSAILGLDPVRTARQIAYDTGRTVELRVTELTNLGTRYRFDASGQVWRLVDGEYLALDPLTGAPLAWDAHLSPDHVRDEIDLDPILDQSTHLDWSAEDTEGFLIRRVRAVRDGIDGPVGLSLTSAAVGRDDVLATIASHLAMATLRPVRLRLTAAGAPERVLFFDQRGKEHKIVDGTDFYAALAERAQRVNPDVTDAAAVEAVSAHVAPAPGATRRDRVLLTDESTKARILYHAVLAWAHDHLRSHPHASYAAEYAEVLDWRLGDEPNDADILTRYDVLASLLESQPDAAADERLRRLGMLTAVLDRDPLTYARRIAYDTGQQFEVHFTDLDGQTQTVQVTPDGRVWLDEYGHREPDYDINSVDIHELVDAIVARDGRSPAVRDAVVASLVGALDRVPPDATVKLRANHLLASYRAAVDGALDRAVGQDPALQDLLAGWKRELAVGDIPTTEEMIGRRTRILEALGHPQELSRQHSDRDLTAATIVRAVAAQSGRLIDLEITSVNGRTTVDTPLDLSRGNPFGVAATVVTAARRWLNLLPKVDSKPASTPDPKSTPAKDATPPDPRSTSTPDPRSTPPKDPTSTPTSAQPSSGTTSNRDEESNVQRAETLMAQYPTLVPIPGDGDCLFSAVLTGARAQANHVVMGMNTVDDLRRAAVAAATARGDAWDQGVPAHLRWESSSRLLVDDLDARQAQDVLREAGLDWAGADVGTLAEAMENAGPTRRTVLLNGVVRAYQDTATGAGAARLAEWYRSYAREHGRLPQVREAVLEALRDRGLWNSPAGDNLPAALADLAGINLVVLQRQDGWFGRYNVVTEYGAGRPVQVVVVREHRGRHYSTLGPRGYGGPTNPWTFFRVG